jgi:uncharacterized protein YjbI with pentapeptide repeats
MKNHIFTLSLCAIIVNIATPVLAENPQHLLQLTKTKKCPKCDLRGANLVGIDLTDANLQNANLTGANLIFSNLTNANLQGANLNMANLTGATLNEANLNNANLIYANLINVELIDTKMNQTNLTGANLVGVNFSDAEIKDINITGANLTNVQGLPLLPNPQSLVTDHDSKAPKTSAPNLAPTSPINRPRYRLPRVGTPDGTGGAGTRIKDEDQNQQNK